MYGTIAMCESVKRLEVRMARHCDAHGVAHLRNNDALMRLGHATTTIPQTNDRRMEAISSTITIV